MPLMADGWIRSTGEIVELDRLGADSALGMAIYTGADPDLKRFYCAFGAG